MKNTLAVLTYIIGRTKYLKSIPLATHRRGLKGKEIKETKKQHLCKNALAPGTFRYAKKKKNGEL